ncbi:hypothetical protein GCM10023334_090170 [Nonomuraea thailandensis]
MLDNYYSGPVMDPKALLRSAFAAYTQDLMRRGADRSHLRLPALSGNRDTDPSQGEPTGTGIAGVSAEYGPRLDPAARPPLFITRVLPGSPAARAGIRPGDIVVKANGVPAFIGDTVNDSTKAPPTRSSPSCGTGRSSWSSTCAATAEGHLARSHGCSARSRTARSPATSARSRASACPTGPTTASRCSARA